MHHKTLLLVISTILTMTACNQPKNTNLELRDQLFQSNLNAIRLGDGVPLNLDIAIRWKIDDMVEFLRELYEDDNG